jgi:transposase
MTDTLASSNSGGEKTPICSHCGHRCRGRYDKKVLRVRDLPVAGWRIYLEFERWRVNCPRCAGVQVAHLDWLAKNSRYTQRFAMHVGKLCRDMPNKAVAEMERLHHSTVKDLDCTPSAQVGQFDLIA